MHLRRDSGQASIELVGLIAVVALVLVAAGGIAAVAAPGLSNRVTTAMQRALCTVSGQRCASLDRQPCPTLRTDKNSTTRATIGFLKLGDDRGLAIERRSDGSYVIRVVEGLGRGVGATWGKSGGEASAEALLSFRAGRTFTAPDRASAEVLVGRLRKHPLPAAESLVRGAADLAGLADAEEGVDTYDLSGKGAASAAAKLGFGGIVAGGVNGDAGLEIGLRVAAHRKEATAFVQLDSRVGAFFDVLPAAVLTPARGRGRGRGGSGEAAGGGGEAGKPLGTLLNPDKLNQSTEAVARGSIELKLAPGPRVVAVDITATVGAGKTLREVHASLDPSEPAVAEALADWRRHPTDVSRLSALGRAASTSAVLDERRFAVDRSDKEYGGEVGYGPGLGLTHVDERRTATLVEQRTRPLGGVWETRLDCVA